MAWPAGDVLTARLRGEGWFLRGRYAAGGCSYGPV